MGWEKLQRAASLTSSPFAEMSAQKMTNKKVSLSNDKFYVREAAC